MSHQPQPPETPEQRRGILTMEESLVVDIPVHQDSSHVGDRHHVGFDRLNSGKSDDDRVVVLLHDLEVEDRIAVTSTLELHEDDEDVAVDAHAVKDHDGIDPAEMIAVEADVVAGGKDVLGLVLVRAAR